MPTSRHGTAAAAIALTLSCVGAAASAQVLATTNVQFLDSAPAALGSDDLTSYTHAFLFEEQAGLTLANDLPVQIAQPGAYNPGDALGATIDANTDVGVYMFHWDLPSGTRGRIQGSITLQPNQQILGVITSNDSLRDTDPILGLPGVAYANNDASRRIELEPDVIGTSGEDFLILSADRQTLTFDLGLGSVGIDEMRLLTSARQIPAPAGVGALALGGLAMTRRRRSAG